MPDIPITEFGIRNVEAAYKEVKTAPLMMAVIGVATAVAVSLMVRQLLQIMHTARNDGDGTPKSKQYTELLWQLGAFTVIVSALPFIIYFVEAVLAEMQISMINALGGEPKGFAGTMVSEMEAMQRRYPTGPSLFDTIPDIFAYFNVLYLKPFLAWWVRYLYAMALAGRFLYLLLLEIVAPVAVVLLLDKKTEGHFTTWLKHVMVCYLLIPAFILANVLGDKMVVTLFGDPYSLIAILAQFFVKLYLIGQGKTLVFKLL